MIRWFDYIAIYFFTTFILNGIITVLYGTYPHNLWGFLGIWGWYWMFLNIYCPIRWNQENKR